MRKMHPDPGTPGDDGAAAMDPWDRFYSQQRWRTSTDVGWFLKELPADTRVLDLGCGTGTGGGPFVAAGHQVDGYESSRVALCRWTGPNGRLCQADAGRLPIRDDAYGAAILLFLLGHLERGLRGAVLREVRRVVRPGGRLLATLAGAGDVRASVSGVRGGIRTWYPAVPILRGDLAAAGWGDAAITTERRRLTWHGKTVHRETNVIVARRPSE